MHLTHRLISAQVTAGSSIKPSKADARAFKVERVRAPEGGATGKLRQLPHAPKADELLRRAASRAAKVPRDAAEPNARRRAAKQAAARADAMGQAVSVPLRQVLDAHAPEALRRSLHAARGTLRGVQWRSPLPTSALPVTPMMSRAAADGDGRREQP